MARRPAHPHGGAPPPVRRETTAPIRAGAATPQRAAKSRGRYFTTPQATDAYPGVLTERLIRRLVAERRIAFTYAGRRIVL
ncbi:MAG: hypothetical protein ABIW46_02640, partial [Acidimicrobiales bacterium]